MKLSEKGYLKIGNSIVGWVENGILKVTFDADKLEFNQADFKDCVVLTVEEAKEFLIAFQDLIELHEDGYIKITDFGFDTFDLVKKRIEKAEKGNA